MRDFDQQQLNKIIFPLVEKLWPNHNFSQPSSVLPNFNYTNPSYPEGFSNLYKFTDRAKARGDEESTDNPFQDAVNRDLLEKSMDHLLTDYAAGFLEERARSTPSFSDYGVKTILIEGSPGSGPAAISRQRPQINHLFPEYLAEQLSSTNIENVCFKGINISDLGLNLQSLITIILSPDKYLPDEALSGEWPKEGYALNKSLETALSRYSKESEEELFSCRGFTESSEGKELESLIIDYLGNKKTPPTNDEVLGQLDEGCSQCHDDEKKESFVGIDLPLNSVEKLAKYKDGLVLRRLECGEMPLDGALNYLSPDVRAGIIHTLRKFK